MYIPILYDKDHKFVGYQVNNIGPVIFFSEVISKGVFIFQ